MSPLLTGIGDLTSTVVSSAHITLKLSLEAKRRNNVPLRTAAAAIQARLFKPVMVGLNCMYV